MAKPREPFRPMTHNEVGRVYREKLGGPFYPVEVGPKPSEKWYCDSGGCNRWRDESGEYRGVCPGYCFADY